MRSAQSQSPRKGCQERRESSLACYAVSEANCGGRAFDEEDHDYRSCFQRDRDRIIHCSAFRRLDFKTQVFVPHEHDHFRTRLTHTIEVAQIARDLGRALRLNEDLIEAVALAHDLGHPPFGHGGEEALDMLMADHGHFEHNRQSLRIVDYLEHPYPRFRGLNLTRSVRECIAKHRTRYDSPICEEFDTELSAPLEGQLVDLADEIAYTAADLEDALAAGWIIAGDLAGLALWRRGASAAEAAMPQARPIHKRIRTCKAVLAAMADDLLAATATNIERMGIDSADIARRASRPSVAFSAAMAEALKEMQQFLLSAVYLHPDNTVHDRQAKKIIRELFAAYVTQPQLMPQRYQKRLPADGPRRVVCDYIAGMTDRFCKQEYSRVC